MSKYYIYPVIGVMTILAVIAVVYFKSLPESSEDVVYNKKVHIRYSFLLKNEGNQVVEGAKFSMFAPYQLDARQKLVTYQSSQPVNLVADNNGNYSFEIDNLLIPPFGSKSLTVSLEMEVVTDFVKETTVDLMSYLDDDLYLNMDDPKIVELAKQFSGKDDNQLANQIYLWLVNNIQVLNYVAQAKGAKYAIEQKTGDCTEMMHAFMALARLNGIPARAVGGFVVEGDATVVHANDYHNWAEYYNGERWVIVDPQKQLFDKTGNLTYVIFRYFDQQDNQGVNTQRFIFSDKNVSVSML